MKWDREIEEGLEEYEEEQAEVAKIERYNDLIRKDISRLQKILDEEENTTNHEG